MIWLFRLVPMGLVQCYEVDQRPQTTGAAELLILEIAGVRRRVAAPGRPRLLIGGLEKVETPPMPDQHSLHNSSNALLSKLQSAQANRFTRSLEPVNFTFRQVIYEPGEAIRYAYFPEVGMISVVSAMADGRSIEVGTIGREGMAGGVLMLETDAVPYRYFVQAPGHGQRIAADELKQAAQANDALRHLILKYEAQRLAQTMQCVACNGLHSVVQRCCRWLLMARDRVDTDDLEITHEFLALMLGVRRASISEVLRPLQQQGLVRCTRGIITIVDRAGLEAGACECYGIIADQFKAMVD